MTRKINVSLEPVSGTINYFLAFVNGEKIISDDGTKKRSKDKDLPVTPVNLKIRVVGIDSAVFKLGIDLPGTANDQTITFSLQNGYYEADLTI